MTGMGGDSGTGGVPAQPALIRSSFVEQFGEDEAARIEAAAIEHANGVNDANRGTDTFKWALLICIGYECMEKERFRKHHRITAPWSELHDWIVQHGDLGSHDGDSDYIALFAGVYDEYVKVNA